MHPHPLARQHSTQQRRTTNDPRPQKMALAQAKSGRMAAAQRSVASRRPMRVLARAATKQAPPKVQEAKTSGLAVLAKIEQLGLLSKVEELGLLSKLESSGLTLSKIEESGLLTQLEKSGVLSLVASKDTPGLVSTLGFALLAAAGAVVYFVPDESTGLLAAQAAGAAALGGAGVAALVAGNLLSDLQKP